MVIRALRVTSDPGDPHHLRATPEAQREARTAEDGSYRLYGLAPGTYLIGPVVDTLADLGRIRIEVADPPVTAESGTPAVTLYRRSGEAPFVGQRVTLRPEVRDGGGVLEVVRITPATYDVEVRFPGYLPARFTGVPVRGAERTVLEIDELRRGAEVRVRVVDEAGAPLPGVLVRLFRVTPNEVDGRVRRTLSAVPADSPSLQRAVSDAAGEVRFEGVEPGEHQLHLTRGEGPFYQGPYTVDTVTVREEDLERPLELVEVLREGVVVPFVLEDRAGRPLPGATVNLTRVVPGFAGVRSSGVADTDGVARVPHVVPGLHEIEVFAARALEEGRVSQLVFRARVLVDGDRPVRVSVP